MAVHVDHSHSDWVCRLRICVINQRKKAKSGTFKILALSKLCSNLNCQGDILMPLEDGQRISQIYHLVIKYHSRHWIFYDLLIDHWWHFHNDQTKIRLEDYSLVYQLFQKLQSWPPEVSQYSFLQCDSIMMGYKSYHKTSSTMQKLFHQTFLNPFIGLLLWTMKQKYTGIFLIRYGKKWPCKGWSRHQASRTCRNRLFRLARGVSHPGIILTLNSQI